jgi:hypothetical protein
MCAALNIDSFGRAVVAVVDWQTVREVALALPEVEEHHHWGRPSFRVRKKIFVTLWPDEQRAVLKLDLADQEAFIRFDPATFSMVPGFWGQQGSTNVQLERVGLEELRQALVAAWRQVAPKRLIAAYEQGPGHETE